MEVWANGLVVGGAGLYAQGGDGSLHGFGGVGIYAKGGTHGGNVGSGPQAAGYFDGNLLTSGGLVVGSAYSRNALRNPSYGTVNMPDGYAAFSGNVGIGTTASTQRLTVAGNINKSGSWIAGDAVWGANFFEIHNSSWDGSANGNYGGIIGGHFYAYSGMDIGTGSGNEAAGGQLVAAVDIKSPIYYDRNNTGYYVDPDGTSEMNLFTRGTLARSSLNALQNNSPVTTRSAQVDGHRNGVMGWGTTDMNTIYSNWGSGFYDSWSSPANGPGASSHYVGMQAFHYNHQDGTNGYGWQMAYAGGSNNRFFWRSGWPGPQAWVEMLTTGNATTLYPNIGGDNLGNHSATTTLAMNANRISNARGMEIFTGDGSGWGDNAYAIFREDGAWTWPYPDLRIAYHTGIKLGANSSYNGIRFYNDYNMATQTMSVGDGDNNVRINYNIATVGDVISNQNYGLGMVGVYSDTRYQNVWAMGTSWRLPADGTTPGNLYGLAWTHSNIGGQSKAGLSHQLLVMENGVTKVAIGSGIWTNYGIVCATLRSNGFIEPSDARLKINIKPLEGALGKIMAMQGVTYNWNKELEQNKTLTDKLQYGLIAQELEKIIPELINTDEQGWKGIEYSHLVPVLIEALKEQQAAIEQQQQIITTNKDDISFLKEYTKQLEAKINTLAADKNATGNK